MASRKKRKAQRLASIDQFMQALMSETNDTPMVLSESGDITIQRLPHEGGLSLTSALSEPFIHLLWRGFLQVRGRTEPSRLAEVVRDFERLCHVLEQEIVTAVNTVESADNHAKKEAILTSILVDGILRGLIVVNIDSSGELRYFSASHFPSS
jgi:hypothetical protein